MRNPILVTVCACNLAHRGNAAALRAARVALERCQHQVLEAAALDKQAGRTVAQIHQGFVELGCGASVVVLSDSIRTQELGQTLEEFNQITLKL